MVQLHAENEPVRVESAKGSVPALTCRWAAGPAERSTLRIALDRGKWDGRPFNAEVRVHLQTPAGEWVIIPVSVRSEEYSPPDGVHRPARLHEPRRVDFVPFPLGRHVPADHVGHRRTSSMRRTQQRLHVHLV